MELIGSSERHWAKLELDPNIEAFNFESLQIKVPASLASKAQKLSQVSWQTHPGKWAKIVAASCDAARRVQRAGLWHRAACISHFQKQELNGCQSIEVEHQGSRLFLATVFSICNGPMCDHACSQACSGYADGYFVEVVVTLYIQKFNDLRTGQKRHRCRTCA